MPAGAPSLIVILTIAASLILIGATFHQFRLMHWDIEQTMQRDISRRIAYDNLVAVQRFNSVMRETAKTLGDRSDPLSAIPSLSLAALQEEHSAVVMIAITRPDFSPLSVEHRSLREEKAIGELRRAVEVIRQSPDDYPATAKLSESLLALAYPILDRDNRRTGYLLAVLTTRNRLPGSAQTSEAFSLQETQTAWVTKEGNESMSLRSATPPPGEAGNAIEFLPLNTPFERWLVRTETKVKHSVWEMHKPSLMALHIAVAITSVLSALGLAMYIQQRYVAPLERITQTIENMTEGGREQDGGHVHQIDRLRDAIQSLDAQIATTQSTNQEKIGRLFADIERAQRHIEDMADRANLVAFSIDLPGCTVSFHTRSLLTVLELEDTGGAPGCLSLLRCFSPAERRLLVNHARLAIKDGDSRFELPVGNAWFDCQLLRTYVAGSDHLRIDGLCIDITERHAYEASLARSEAHQTSLITGAFEGILTLDGVGRITGANPAACRLLGMTEDALQNQEFTSHFLATGDRLPAAVATDAMPTSAKILTLQVGNSLIPVVAATFLLPGQTQALYLYDLRAIQAREAALDERNAIIKAIYESAPSGLISFDNNNRETLHNGQLIQMLNLHSIALEGISESDFLSLVAAYEQEPVSVKVRRALSPDEKALVVRSPLTRIIKYRKHALFGADSAACAYRFRDITDSYQLDAMKSNFLATAAHELRTPLTTIMGFSEILNSPEITIDEAESRELLTSIFQQSQLLSAMIGDLLDLARIDADGGETVKRVRMDLQAFLQALYRNCTIPGEGSRLKGQHPVSLVTPEQPLWIMGDTRKLERIALNLISNADKYSPAEAPILVRLDVRDWHGRAMACLSVEDRGIGMTPEELAHAKTRFWRADNSGKVPGTGLGLALVNELVELHGGHLLLTSSKGEGTTASVFLPLAAADGGTQKTENATTVA